MARQALNGKTTLRTCPTIMLRSIGPIRWLSFELERLSPRTKYCPSGTVYALME